MHQHVVHNVIAIKLPVINGQEMHANLGTSKGNSVADNSYNNSRQSYAVHQL
jgi:hypothetical protein